MDCLTSRRLFAENLQLKMSVFCTKVSAFSKAGPQVHMMTGQSKSKEKVPDVSDPN